MSDRASRQPTPSPTEPRLLRFMVNGQPCYAMKWRDERTENRREVDYVMREAGTAETFCLLVDCPLRVPGTPDVVSVESSGRTITRAETTWDLAVTVWEDGATDDEALVRFCHPDCLPRHGELLVRDLNRMIREYRQGTRECHDLVPSPTAVDPKPADLGPLERRFDAIETALRQAGAAKTDSPPPVTEDTLRQHLVPVIRAVEDGNRRTVNTVATVVTRGIDEVAPHCAVDRARAFVVWVRKCPG